MTAAFAVILSIAHLFIRDIWFSGPQIAPSFARLLRVSPSRERSAVDELVALLRRTAPS